MGLCPQDMTDSEKTLLATITAQTIARRQPRTETEMEAARSEADEIAAETIGAARTERAFSEAEGEPPPAWEGWTARVLPVPGGGGEVERDDVRRRGGPGDGGVGAVVDSRERLGRLSPRRAVDDNLGALEALAAAERDGRDLTADEWVLVQRWHGWGAAPQFFDRPDFTRERARLRELVGDAGVAAARPNHTQRPLHRRDPG